MISSIDGSCLDAHTSFCPKCVEEMKTEMIADFREERREMTRVARAEEWTDGDISAMRVELRDQLYERLKYVNKPLPALPDGEGQCESLAKSLRKYVLQCQSAGFERHNAFKVAVSGGSLPKTLTKALLAQDDEEGKAEFSKWEVFFADERAVPLDHEDSNYKLLKDELLDKIPESMGKPIVHPIDVQYMDDVQEMADQYQDALMKSFAAKDSVKIPIFDLLLLGCGPDGHTCSLFPNHELLRESDAWVAPIEDSPKPPKKRITLTLPVVTGGIKIAFVATGEGKREILSKILDTEEGRSLPCGLVNEGGAEKVSWFTDHGAIQGVKFPSRGSL
ncbi:MAG: suppressor of los1-1 [Alectoria sarmentosa]|nr:MAG: suppressor of los1-1 [Alectoria sarmentosa]